MDAKKKLTQKELLEVSSNISKYYAPKYLPNKENLVVLPLDSQHLYAYWTLPEVNHQSSIIFPVPNEAIDVRRDSVGSEKFENSLCSNSSNLPELTLPRLTSVAPNDTLMLRIYSVHTQTLKRKPVIEFSINEKQSKQKIKLPVINEDVIYSASIGRIIPKHGFIQLIKSNSTHSLQQRVEPNKDNVDADAVISGRKKQFKFVREARVEKLFSLENMSILMGNHSGLGIVQ